MKTIQQIAFEASAAQPGFCSKDEAAANELAKSMNDIADEGESYDVVPYQGGRFVVAVSYNGQFEQFL